MSERDVLDKYSTGLRRHELSYSAQKSTSQRAQAVRGGRTESSCSALSEQQLLDKLQRPPSPTRYAFTAIADNVAEKQRIARGYVLDRGLPTQRAVLEYETLGWWLTIGDNSFYLGAEKPGISVGDRIGITIERISE